MDIERINEAGFAELENIRQNIALFIKRSKKSRKLVCFLAGVSASSLSDWMTGKRRPSIDSLRRLAEVFKCDLRDFYLPPSPDKIPETLEGLTIEGWRARALRAERHLNLKEMMSDEDNPLP